MGLNNILLEGKSDRDKEESGEHFPRGGDG